MKKFLDCVQSVLLILFIIFLFVVLPGGYIIMAICGMIKNPRGFVELIVIAMIFAAVFLVYKTYTLSVDKKVSGRESWWLLSSSYRVLEDAISVCQLNPIKIENEFLPLRDSEKAIAREIIGKFQEHSKDRPRQLKRTYKNAKEPYLCFFMICLDSFLGDKNDVRFHGNEMYIEKSRERRDDAGSYYDITYSVTEYGMVYNKLRYMAQFYVDKINQVEYNLNSNYAESTKKILDIKEIHFFEDIN